MNATDTATVEVAAHPAAQAGAGVRMVLFGHFGGPNLGNESTLYTLICRMQELIPGVSWVCACTGPEKAKADYNIAAVPCRGRDGTPARERTFWGKILRKITGVAREAARWRDGFQVLHDARALIIPGTGLLTDAYGLRGWGPYDLFRWTMTAKLCGCRVLFVSVGAGPIYSRAGKFLIRAALSMADFRSYRDESSREYLAKIGCRVKSDPVYPDLVFALPHRMRPHGGRSRSARRAVGIGLMAYAKRYSAENPGDSTYEGYLESITVFVRWLLARDYDVRLLIGDLADAPVIQEFRRLLSAKLPPEYGGRVIDEPVASVSDLLAQLASLDYVVATRYHNVLLAMVLGKPALAISFHPKCSALMEQMGLTGYCQDIHQLRGEELIERFSELELSAANVQQKLKTGTALQRAALEEQFLRIFECLHLPEQCTRLS